MALTVKKWYRPFSKGKCASQNNGRSCLIAKYVFPVWTGLNNVRNNLTCQNGPTSLLDVLKINNVDRPLQALKFTHVCHKGLLLIPNLFQDFLQYASEMYGYKTRYLSW